MEVNFLDPSSCGVGIEVPTSPGWVCSKVRGYTKKKQKEDVS